MQIPLHQLILKVSGYFLQIFSFLETDFCDVAKGLIVLVETLKKFLPLYSEKVGCLMSVALILKLRLNSKHYLEVSTVTPFSIQSKKVVVDIIDCNPSLYYKEQSIKHVSNRGNHMMSRGNNAL